MAGIRLSPLRNGARGLKRWYDLNIKLYKVEKYIHFWAELCNNMHYPPKKVQIKVSRHRVSDKKVCESIRLPPLWSGARGLERWYGLNMKLYRSGKIHSLLGWTLAKIHIIPKKASNKSFSTSNCGQKNPWGHTSISPPGVEREGSKDDMV